MSDELRRKILERRARFVTAAVASAGLAACRPCLEVVPPDDGVSSDAAVGDAGPGHVGGADASVDAVPIPCLSVPPEDTGIADAGPDTKEAGPKPRPCLKVAPKACLDY